MNRAGDNNTTKYLENPYLDGVISAITTQGEVTLNCRAEYGEVKTRRNNMSSNASRAVSYPGGDNIDNLHIMPHELVFGWVNRQGRNVIPGHPNQIGFTSLNGLKWGSTSTDEELESRIRFLCVAKTPFIFDNQYQLKHGFTGIAVGTATTFHTGEVDFFPGDKIHWSVVPRSAMLGKAAVLSEGGIVRYTNPRVGTPRGKIRFRINPSRFNSMLPSLNAAVSAMKKPMARGGVEDRPYEHLFNEMSLGGREKPNPVQELAMALFYASLVGGVRMIHVLQQERATGLDLNTIDQVGLCERIGIFSTDKSQRVLADKIVDALFLDVIANKEQSIVRYRELQQMIPGGFTPKGQVLRNASTASRFVQVATNMGNINLVAYSRAVHAISRKHIGVALCYAKRGQRVDVLIGHFLETH